MSSQHNAEWLNYPFPLGTVVTETVASPGYTPSSQFECNFPVVVDKLAWWRYDATGPPPTRLALWRVSDTTEIAFTTAITDDLQAGWQDSVLPVAVVLAPGTAYKVAAYFPTGSHDTGVAVDPRPTAGGAFIWQPTITGYRAIGAYGYPNFDDTSGFVRGLDVHQSTVAPGVVPGGSTAGDVANQFAAWLSTDDNTHHVNGLPWLTKAVVDGTATTATAISDQQAEWAFGLGAAAHGYYADVRTLIGNIKSITDTLPTPIAQLTSIVLDHYTADIAGILAQIDGVLSNLGAQSTDLSGTAGSAVGALSGRTGFPATGWSMAAEEDFEDAIAFAEPADAYVLTVTSYQDTQPANESPAGLWLPRLGWWCVLNGTLASQRQFVDFQQMILEDQGRRMPGCAIQLRPGTLATVQAWLLA